MCAQFQLKFHAIMPCGVSPERIAILEAFGAEVELTDSPLGLRGAIDRARQFAADKPAMATDQFANPDNPAAHRYQTAPEILSQIPSRSVGAVVSGVGTGGTLVGLFEGFCDFGCAPLPVAARPICLRSAFELECSSFSSRIPGVADCLSTIFRDASLPGLRELDIEDEVALTTTRRLLLAGFPVGPSSGLNYAAAVAIASELGDDASVVTIFPDRMERYLSTGLLAKAR
jgi:cysteine synthase A